jgi:hypothetical protein
MLFTQATVAGKPWLSVVKFGNQRPLPTWDYEENKHMSYSGVTSSGTYTGSAGSDQGYAQGQTRPVGLSSDEESPSRGGERT